ncbi:hypothetical protein IJJ12_01345 [bacterium]|nr:hypothetical protein [bacterium]
MKKTLIIASMILAMATSVQARTYTERECSTDSYGNTTCRDKITNVDTGVITYSNESVTRGVVSGGRIVSGTTGTRGVVGQQITILNTATPAFVPMLATGVVALGAVSMVVKTWRRQTAA